MWRGENSWSFRTNKSPFHWTSFDWCLIFLLHPPSSALFTSLSMSFAWWDHRNSLIPFFHISSSCQHASSAWKQQQQLLDIIGWPWGFSGDGERKTRQTIEKSVFKSAAQWISKRLATTHVASVFNQWIVFASSGLFSASSKPSHA